MKASLKGRYNVDKNGAAATIGIPFGDVKFGATITDATVVNGPKLSGLALTVEKPGFFLIDYNVPKMDFRFQFMNTVRVAEKPLNLTYIHHRGDNQTILEGSLVFDPRNKFSANYLVGPGNCKLKYSYAHRGLTTFEPCYDLSKGSWDLALCHKVYGDDVLKATYQTSSRVLALDWSRNSKIRGCFKVSASVNLNDESRVPKLTAESTWNFDM